MLFTHTILKISVLSFPNLINIKKTQYEGIHGLHYAPLGCNITKQNPESGGKMILKMLVTYRLTARQHISNSHCKQKSLIHMYSSHKKYT
jgi:hypothetical protein